MLNSVSQNFWTHFKTASHQGQCLMRQCPTRSCCMATAKVYRGPHRICFILITGGFYFYFGLSSRRFLLEAHWLWSGFKSFEKVTFILKPDRMKFETFNVHGTCIIFSAFCNFNFQLVEVVPQFSIQE